MARKTKRVRAAYKLAIEDATARDKGVVVSVARARWKENHDRPSNHVIRMVRFVWMRSGLGWDDRFKLHAGVLGACMRSGYITKLVPGDEIVLTTEGAELLERDRRRA